MSSRGAAARAAVPATSTRAETSRKNGAKSRGPKTPEGKVRSAQNALKHGMRAQKYLVLPDEEAAEFAALEAAMIEELAPCSRGGSRSPRGVWPGPTASKPSCSRSAGVRAAGSGSRCLAAGLGNGAPTPFRRPSDGNGARSFETPLRNQGAAMAEFWRALRTLKALQAEQALEDAPALASPPIRPGLQPHLVDGPRPNEPERCPQRRIDTLISEPSRGLHESPVIWQPNEPEPMRPTRPGGCREGRRTDDQTNPALQK